MKASYLLCAVISCSIGANGQTNIFPSTGNAGIGTTSPQFSFEIVGNGQIIRNTGPTSYSTLRLYNNQNNALRALEIDYASSAYPSSLLNGGVVGEAGAIGTTGPYPLMFGTDNTARLIVSSTGNVGIGTNSPTAKLDVQGGIVAKYNSGNQLSIQTNAYRWDFDVDENSSNNFRLRNMTSGTVPFMVGTNGFVGIGTTNPGGRLEINHAGGQLKLTGGTVAAGLWTSSADMLHLADWNTGTKGLNINMTSGNVGIGTATPGTYKLAVEGKIGAREVNVTTTAWSDYVFNSDYKLRPLSEVQQFIEENRHLPEVPSEKEVMANGQNLGEMNAILLKKIEELTLYMIETKKEIQELKSDNDDLKKMIHGINEKGKK